MCHKLLPIGGDYVAVVVLHFPFFAAPQILTELHASNTLIRKFDFQYRAEIELPICEGMKAWVLEHDCIIWV